MSSKVRRIYIRKMFRRSTRLPCGIETLEKNASCLSGPREICDIKYCRYIMERISRRSMLAHNVLVLDAALQGMNPANSIGISGSRFAAPVLSTN